MRLAILCLLLPGLALAVSITNSSTGLFTNGATWSGGVAPSAADEGVITGLTVTADTAITVDTLRVTGGTLTISATDTNTVYNFLHTGGTVNFSNALVLTTNYNHSGGTRNSGLKLSLFTNGLTNTLATTDALLSSNLVVSTGNSLTTITGQGTSNLTLNGGSVRLGGGNYRIFETSIPTVTTNTTWLTETSGFGMYLMFFVPNGGTQDVSSVFQYLTLSLADTAFTRCFRMWPFSGGAKTTILCTNVSVFTSSARWMGDGSTRGTYSTTTPTDYIFSNCAMAVNLASTWLPNIPSNSSVTFINCTLTNSFAFSGSAGFGFGLNTNCPVSFYSCVATAYAANNIGLSLPHNLTLSNTTIYANLSANLSTVNYTGATVLNTLDGTNSYYLLDFTQILGNYPNINGGDWPFTQLKCRASFGARLSAATTFRGLRLLQGLFSPNGFTLTSSNIDIYTGTFGASNSTLITSSLVQTGGTFNVGTSTLQYGPDNSPGVLSNVPAVFSVSSVVAGKTVSVVSNLTVNGTLTFTGASLDMNNRTLTLSNPSTIAVGSLYNATVQSNKLFLLHGTRTNSTGQILQRPFRGNQQ